jgi:hypothetical protein
MTAMTTMATSARMMAYSTSPWPFSFGANNMIAFLSIKRHFLRTTLSARNMTFSDRKSYMGVDNAESLPFPAILEPGGAPRCCRSCFGGSRCRIVFGYKISEACLFNSAIDLIRGMPTVTATYAPFVGKDGDGAAYGTYRHASFCNFPHADPSCF